MKTQSTYPRVLMTLLSAVAFSIASNSLVSAQTLAGQNSGASSGVANGLFTHGSEAFRVVDTAGYRTAGDVGSHAPGLVQQVGHHGACSSCGTACGGSCGGSAFTSAMEYSSCGSCGTACGGSCGRRSSALTCGPNFTDPCTPCQPYRYISIEGLYMAPDIGSFTLSPNFGLSDMDEELGTRITIGAVGDCVNGYEISFTGPFEWDLARQINSPGGGINSFLSQTGVALPSFTDAVSQTQTYSADYYSLEANKTLVGWEMAKLLIGGRYINYDEDYNYFSTTATQTGSLTSRTRNDLFGVQVGMDLLYPISRHGFTDIRARAGLYANSADSNVLVRDGASTLARAGDSTTDLAGMFEFGSGIRYQLGEILSVRAGLELWYLTGVASAPNQVRPQINSGTGRSIDTDNDILFTGISFGTEIRY
ncbi:hypothetical protein K227x_12240 [Rubripirellula lacrimiformis]|uniref:Outer membrane protein beta-barrel domain-containing protein n=1 Tax=Rubripirellula lacrimiformis TaxID=1930273 RepID=A0A517N6U5_9BACT|nr:hypothetical protein [Rubripirellula lacrimiformis]QDT02845.1 hypothetical protein K227x_12240 [Rubripirellula lacrimiformis]